MEEMWSPELHLCWFGAPPPPETQVQANPPFRTPEYGGGDNDVDRLRREKVGKQPRVNPEFASDVAGLQANKYDHEASKATYSKVPSDFIRTALVGFLVGTDVHIGFSTMDAKVNDTKILIKKLVLDPNMNRGMAVGVGSSSSSSSSSISTSSSSSSSSAPPPPQPKPAAKGRSSKPVPKRGTQSRLAFN